jgi:tetratricopeptide (TPR) repeat protein
MLDPGNSPTARYSAFISYCRRDARDARWLQAALEEYRLPNRLIGQPTPLGPVPERFLPVFLDRSELTVASDLAEELAHALAASQFLIVLCTPRAAVSHWVNREVGMMQAAGRAEQILAALFDGDERDAFPPALRESEHGGVFPLAADFRKNGDGRRLALLKLVAVMAGVGLGELVHREEARRARRLMGVAAASMAGMAAFAGVSLYALQAKTEAEAERAKSEALVGALVTDLRETVKPLGSLAVLGEVNEIAGRYFRGQSLDDMPDAALAQRARLLTAMGEDEVARGALGPAGLYFEEASRTTAARLNDAPDDPARIFDHAQSRYWVGFQAWNAGRPDETRKAWLEYRGLAQKLLATDPTKADWLLEAGYAESNLGSLALRQNLDVAEAQNRFQRALTFYREVHAQQPNDVGTTLDLSDGLAWLADSQRWDGNASAAFATRQEQRELLLEELRKTPDMAAFRRQLMSNTIALGRIHAAAGRYAAADTMFAEALTMGQDLFARDPDDAVVAGGLRMADLFRLHGRLLAGVPGSKVALPDCAPSASTVTPDETEDWCTLVSARARLGVDPPGNLSRTLSQVAGRQVGGGRPRLSPGFGIDFSAEIASIEAAAAASGGNTSRGG